MNELMPAEYQATCIHHFEEEQWKRTKSISAPIAMSPAIPEKQSKYAIFLDVISPISQCLVLHK